MPPGVPDPPRAAREDSGQTMMLSPLGDLDRRRLSRGIFALRPMLWLLETLLLGLCGFQATGFPDSLLGAGRKTPRPRPPALDQPRARHRRHGDDVGGPGPDPRPPLPAGGGAGPILDRAALRPLAADGDVWRHRAGGLGRRGPGGACRARRSPSSRIGRWPTSCAGTGCAAAMLATKTAPSFPCCRAARSPAWADRRQQRPFLIDVYQLRPGDLGRLRP